MVDPDLAVTVVMVEVTLVLMEITRVAVTYMYIAIIVTDVEEVVLALVHVPLTEDMVVADEGFRDN